MQLFLKIFIGFCVVWILWYVTGGPLRDTKNPFIAPDDASGLHEFNTQTKDLKY